MFTELTKYLNKPELYAPSTDVFWDNPHISEVMLDTHLNPDYDSATRKHSFVDKSVDWISTIASPSQYPTLLDIGCGPGIYAERFAKKGYNVTGIDFSARSIRYAQVQSALDKTNIEYHYQNYLTIDYEEQFDVVTLIYCDYAALSVTDRHTLLKKVYKALKPGGKFIFDVFTHKMRKPEERTWYYSESGGFYSEKPHAYLVSVYQYDDEDKTELRQSIVITDDAVECYNVWDHFFTKDEIVNEVLPVGFKEYKVYGDVAGTEFSASGDTICCILTKKTQTFDR